MSNHACPNFEISTARVTGDPILTVALSDAPQLQEKPLGWRCEGADLVLVVTAAGGGGGTSEVRFPGLDEATKSLFQAGGTLLVGALDDDGRVAGGGPVDHAPAPPRRGFRV